jgi:Type II secretion system (T2SS), protein E, N-terminal domain
VSDGADVRTPAPGVTDAAEIWTSDGERLRDYFLRLGATAEIVDGGVRIELLEDQGHEQTIAEYLGSWAGTAAAPAAAAKPPTASVQPIAAATKAPAVDAFFAARPRLGDLLVGRGLITPQQLADSLVESRNSGELLGRVLIRNGHVFEDELARTLAAQLDLPYVNLRMTGVEHGVARMVPPEEGLRVGAIPIGYRGARVCVAFADPSDETAHDVVQRHVGTFDMAVADMSDIDLAWRTVTRTVSYAGIS